MTLLYRQYNPKMAHTKSDSDSIYLRLPTWPQPEQGNTRHQRPFFRQEQNKWRKKSVEKVQRKQKFLELLCCRPSLMKNTGAFFHQQLREGIGRYHRTTNWLQRNRKHKSVHFWRVQLSVGTLRSNRNCLQHGIGVGSGHLHLRLSHNWESDGK